MSRALAVIALCALGCAGRTAPVEDAPANPQVTLYGVRIQYFKGGTLFSAGRAAKLTYQRSGGDFAGNEGTLRFPARSEELSGVEVRALEFDGNLGAKLATARGEVVVRSATGLVGRTSVAHWDGAAGTASGDQPVDVKGPGYSLRSKGFAFDLAREDFSFVGAVESRLGGSR